MYVKDKVKQKKKKIKNKIKHKQILINRKFNVIKNKNKFKS